MPDDPNTPQDNLRNDPRVRALLAGQGTRIKQLEEQLAAAQSAAEAAPRPEDDELYAGYVRAGELEAQVQQTLDNLMAQLDPAAAEMVPTHGSPEERLNWITAHWHQLKPAAAPRTVNVSSGGGSRGRTPTMPQGHPSEWSHADRAYFLGQGAVDADKANDNYMERARAAGRVAVFGPAPKRKP